MVSKKKNLLYMKNLSLTIPVCRHSASLMMYIDPWGRFVYHTLIIMMILIILRPDFVLQLLEHQDVSHLPAEETHPHVCRVGWSTDDNTMQLGTRNTQ